MRKVSRRGDEGDVNIDAVTAKGKRKCYDEKEKEGKVDVELLIIWKNSRNIRPELDEEGGIDINAPKK